MIRRSCLSAVVVAVLAAVPGATASPSSDPTPSRLLVTAREFSLALSRPKVDAGPAIIQLYNYGEDPHDLKLQRVGSNREYALGEVPSGETGRLDLKLRRKSTYRLWCSIPGHAELGMTATLRTAAKRPPRGR